MSDEPSAYASTGPASHPDDDRGNQAVASDATWATVAVSVLLGALVVTIVVLHLSGVVGPAGHG